MHVVHIYDGHEKVYDGRGSVPGVVWNVARETAASGHEVTVIERQWDGLAKTAEHDGVRFRRLSLSTGSDQPWTRVPYEMVNSPVGLSRLVTDRTNFAIQTLRALHGLDYDVLHVHLPFAANVIATAAPWLRGRMVFTAHLGELRLNAIADDDGSGDTDYPVTDGGTEQTDRADPEADDGPTTVDQAQSDGDDIDVPSVLQYLSPDRILARRVARTTVLNPAIEDTFVEMGVPRDRLAVVPNGVDVKRFGSPQTDVVESVRDQYDLAGRRTVLFVGTVMPRKGVEDLVQAVAAVVNGQTDWGDAPKRRARTENDRRQLGSNGSRDADTGGNGQDVKLVIAGERDLDSAYARKVERRIQDTGLRDCVEVTGFVPAAQLPALYSLADVFVLPSREEGFGMTVVEAMAAGTPVVATTVGDVPRIVESGRHGLLVVPGDTDALANGIDRLLSDPGEREWMGEQARQRARAYSWHSTAEQFIDIYRSIT